MIGKVLLWLALGVAAVVAAPSDAGAAEVAVPRAVGMLPAAEAPDPADDGALAPALQLAGLVLVFAGAVTIARSWVSPKETV